MVLAASSAHHSNLSPTVNMATPLKFFAIAVFHATIVFTNSLTIRVATRSSKLALSQTKQFRNALEKQTTGNAINIEIVQIDTSGDIKEPSGKTPTQNLPLALTGVDFSKELDDAVLSGEADVAVHSLKDIPPDCRWDGSLAIGACLGPRASPLDVLVTKDASIKSIQSLPSGSRVGSASIRRQAQLRAINSSLEVINVRGNVDTRLNALENNEVQALVLAKAGLDRLGILDSETNTIHRNGTIDSSIYFKTLSIEDMLPGLCQGIIAITCHRDNTKILSLLRDIDNYESRIAATTERAYLNVVQELSPWKGRPPLAGYMRIVSTSNWVFNGLLATPDGSQVLKVKRSIQADNCCLGNAYNLGVEAGEEIIQAARVSFLGGYYKILP